MTAGFQVHRRMEVTLVHTAPVRTASTHSVSEHHCLGTFWTPLNPESLAGCLLCQGTDLVPQGRQMLVVFKLSITASRQTSSNFNVSLDHEGLSGGPLGSQV